jgi:putative SOS response-associated peptidase YedK
MCRDYERERQWRMHKAMIDAEYERRRVPELRVITSDAEPNSYMRETTELTKPAPIARMVENGTGLEMTMAHWWFVPAAHKGTYKEFQRKLNTFNARSESIGGSSTFRKAFATRRCLVPASGWYEWTEPPGWKKGKPKTKWRIMVGDQAPTFFAGIWDRFIDADPEAPGPKDTFALITHEAGPGVIDYHDRAPIVMPPSTKHNRRER